MLRDDPGGAHVNHSSNVGFIHNVSHNVVGAACNTDAGDDVGSFIGNMAIGTHNPGGTPNPPDVKPEDDQSPDIRVLTQVWLRLMGPRTRRHRGHQRRLGRVRPCLHPLAARLGGRGARLS